MGLMDLAGALFGGGGQSGASGQQQPGSILGQLAVLVDQQGGLGALLNKFQQNGQGQVAQSWVAPGENKPVTPNALQTVLGSDMVRQLVARTGLPPDAVLPLVAQYLPHLIDAMTPQGHVPQGETLSLTDALDKMKSKAG